MNIFEIGVSNGITKTAFGFATGLAVGGLAPSDDEINDMMSAFRKGIARRRKNKKTASLGVSDGLAKIAAFGPHVDAAVRELRALGHDGLASALLASAGEQARSPREARAVARITRLPNASQTVLKGVTQAISDKPVMWDKLIADVGKKSRVRRSDLAGYAKGLVGGRLDPESPSAAHLLWSPKPPSAAHPLWSPKPQAVIKKPMSTKTKAGLGLAALLTAYGAYRATTPKRYDS